MHAMRNSFSFIGIILFCLICSLSCSKQTETDVKLRAIEAYIQEDPSRALEELSLINIDSLQYAGEQGLYSLLFSMALDKNYIDIKSDSLIAPALSYYSHHGDTYHKFLTYYYHGRVYENAQAYDSALSSFIEAESLLDNSIPEEYQVRLYSAKQRVYNHQLAIEEAGKEILKAKQISRHLDNPEFYYRSSLDLTSHLIQKGKINEANAELDSLRAWMKGKQLSQLSEYYYSRITTLMPAGLAPADSISLWLGEYLSLCTKENTDYDHQLAADAYLALDNLEKAAQEFGLCQEPDDDYNKILYYTTLSKLYEKLGDTRTALEGRYKYEQALERLSLDIFNNDVRFLEERHRDELEKQRYTFTVSWLIVAVVLLVGLIVLATIKAAAKRKAYSDALDNVKAEYEFIKSLTVDENSPAGMQDILQQRIQALRPYITNKRIMPAMPGRKGLEKLDEDRKTMLRSIGMIYALTYPKFVSALVSYSLTAEEIGLCSLYLSGFSSKELSDLLNRGDIYHLNSSIRARIGSPVQSTRLYIWLKNLFVSLQQG